MWFCNIIDRIIIFGSCGIINRYGLSNDIESDISFTFRLRIDKGIDLQRFVFDWDLSAEATGWIID